MGMKPRKKLTLWVTRDSRGFTGYDKSKHIYFYDYPPTFVEGSPKCRIEYMKWRSLFNIPWDHPAAPDMLPGECHECVIDIKLTKRHK